MKKYSICTLFRENSACIFSPFHTPIDKPEAKSQSKPKSNPKKEFGLWAVTKISYIHIFINSINTRYQFYSINSKKKLVSSFMKYIYQDCVLKIWIQMNYVTEIPLCQGHLELELPCPFTWFGDMFALGDQNCQAHILGVLELTDTIINPGTWGKDLQPSSWIFLDLWASVFRTYFQLMFSIASFDWH